MSPTVVAAIIAAIASILTLVGTVATQRRGHRETSRDVDKTLKAQGEQLNTQLEEQRKQLNAQLEEQRKQLDRTLAEQRTRTLNERFATAAEQLGSDKPPAVQLAGVYAMAGLADDWPENRQTCIDVLCAYLRLPYKPDPGEEVQPEHLAFLASREVRWTVIGVIAAHLSESATVSWQGLTFDFNRVIFDGGDFRGAVFSRGSVAVFDGAEFSGGMVRFQHAKFSGGAVFFGGAKFSRGRVRFGHAEFSAGMVSFRDTELSGGTVEFGSAKFSGSTVLFHDARFSGSTVHFHGAEFSGGQVDFSRARFSGGQVDFGRAVFSGGEVGFTRAGDWSVPPVFPWKNAPPGVMLPQEYLSQTYSDEPPPF